MEGAANRQTVTPSTVSATSQRHASSWPWWVINWQPRRCASPASVRQRIRQTSCKQGVPGWEQSTSKFSPTIGDSATRPSPSADKSHTVRGVASPTGRPEPSSGTPTAGAASVWRSVLGAACPRPARRRATLRAPAGRSGVAGGRACGGSGRGGRPRVARRAAPAAGRRRSGGSATARTGGKRSGRRGSRRPAVANSAAARSRRRAPPSADGRQSLRFPAGSASGHPAASAGTKAP